MPLSTRRSRYKPAPGSSSQLPGTLRRRCDTPGEVALYVRRAAGGRCQQATLSYRHGIGRRASPTSGTTHRRSIGGWVRRGLGRVHGSRSRAGCSWLVGVCDLRGRTARRAGLAQRLSGWLSWWAYTWAEGGWKVLAALGVGLSGVALVVVVALFAFRVFVEFPDLITGDANRKQKGRRSRRRRRRGPW